MRIYLDSAPVIYLLEGEDSVKQAVSERLAGTRSGEDEILISELTRLECRVKPIQEGDEELLALYDAFFSSVEITMLSMNAPVWERATRLRATHSFKIPDALHLACAIQNKCDRFLTNDTQLSRCEEIQVEQVQS